LASRSVGEAVLLLAVVVAAVLVRRRSMIASILIAATLASAALWAAVFRGGAGPLARGVWLTSPFTWCALAFTASAFWPAILSWKRAVGIGLGCSAATLLIAVPRIGSRARMWQAIARSDPGDVRSAQAAAQALQAGGDRTGALEIWTTCLRANPKACVCGEGVAEASLFDGSAATASDVLERQRSDCAADPRFNGLRAEALARTNRLLAGAQLADETLALSPHDPHALYAKGMFLLAKGDLDFALQVARDVHDSNALGLEGLLLLDRVWIARGDLDAAQSDLTALRSENASSASIMYLLGQVEDRRNHYHDARENYLAALRIDPNYADARYMLALLTSRFGSMGEAKYNVAQLAIIAPDDPRLPELQKTIGQ
jgi:tetratricopeptide (TPR) repeat protein